MIYKYLAIVAVVCGVVWKIYDFGYDNAEADMVERWATYERQVTAHNLAHEQEIRELQGELQSTADKVNRDAKDKIDKLQGDIVAANVASVSLREQAARYAARAKKCTNNTGDANLRPAASDPAGVLADVLSQSDERSGILAKYADSARIAGEACEIYADELRKQLNEKALQK